MKFLKNDKLSLTLIILILIINCLETNSTSSKISNKKDSQILERENHTDRNQLKNLKNLKIRASNIHEIIEIKKVNKEITFFDRLKIILIVYLQFYLIFCILSFYKWYEEMQRIKQHYIENKFSHFEDLSSNTTMKSLDQLEGAYVFASGKFEIKKGAQDNLFNFKYDKEYGVVERIVEYFDLNSKEWTQLGNLNKVDKSFHNILRDYTTFHQDYWQFNTDKEMYTFPRLISSKFLGRVELQSVGLNSKQLKSLKINERIRLNSISGDSLIMENIMKEFEMNDKRFKKIEWEISEDYIIIYPCDAELNSPRECLSRLRVSFHGYSCDYVSVMSQIKNRSFKTVHIPYEHKYELESDHTSFINESTNMEIVPNFNIDCCNILFCLCLSGHATYIHKESIANSPETFLAKINWVEPKQMSKSDLINEKYGISIINILFIRCLFFIFLTLCLMVFPDAVIYVYKIFGTLPETIKRHKFEYSIVLAKVSFILVLIYTKISFRIKHIFNLFIIITLVVILLYFVTKEIFLLTEI